MSETSHYELVRTFHEHIGASIAVPPSPELLALRSAFAREEGKELEEALAAADLLAICDALADIVYVAYGTAVTLGIELDGAFHEVHRSNMSKDAAGDGKAVKGPRYTRPELTPFLPQPPRG